MNRFRKTVAGAAILGATLAGGAFGAAFLGGTAGAQTDPSSSSSDSTATEAPAPPAHDPSQGGHMANGITEELLTGDAADKATAAAQAAVPDGTIERVETDAEGDAYEAHMVKSDGSHVTVKMDENFNVTNVEEGR